MRRGARAGVWRRALAPGELTRLGYAAMALVAVKLVTEDLRHGHLAYIAASMMCGRLTLTTDVSSTCITALDITAMATIQR